MATHAAARGSTGAVAPAHPRPARKQRQLRVAAPPVRTRRSIADVGTLLAFGLFVLCLGLAALHAVLVENQAELDELSEQNGIRRQRIDQLQAEIADLDSPEGLERHARAAGLVAAAEIVTLVPVSPDRLLPPGVDPFGLDARGIAPALSDPVFSSAADSAPVGIGPPGVAQASATTSARSSPGIDTSEPAR